MREKLMGILVQLGIAVPAILPALRIAPVWKVSPSYDDEHLDAYALAKSPVK